MGTKSKLGKMSGNPKAVAIAAMCEYTGKWMIPTIGFMSLNMISTFFLATKYLYFPSYFCLILTLVHFSRWGTLCSQLMALSWRYQEIKKVSDLSRKSGLAFWGNFNITLDGHSGTGDKNKIEAK